MAPSSSPFATTNMFGRLASCSNSDEDVESAVKNSPNPAPAGHTPPIDKQKQPQWRNKTSRGSSNFDPTIRKASIASDGSPSTNGGSATRAPFRAESGCSSTNGTPGKMETRDMSPKQSNPPKTPVKRTLRAAADNVMLAEGGPLQATTTAPGPPIARLLASNEAFNEDATRPDVPSSGAARQMKCSCTCKDCPCRGLIESAAGHQIVTLREYFRL